MHYFIKYFIIRTKQISICSSRNYREALKILCPAAYCFQKYGKYRTEASRNDPYCREYGTVRSILDNEVYIGTTVNGKSFKTSKKLQGLKKNLKRQISDLQSLTDILRVYEDKVKGEITPKQFKFLLSQYTFEKQIKKSSR